MVDKKRIVVLGGGYGGVEAAKVLSKRFKRRRDIELVLIDRNPFQTLMTELHEVAGGRADPESVTVSFDKIFGARAVTVVTDKATTVDFEKREVVSETARYPYDYLVVGAGGEPEDYGIPGIKEYTFTLWSLPDAIRIRHQIREIFREAAREREPSRRKEMLTFVVAGAGFTGVEMAGELLEWKRSLCREHEIDESEVSVTIVEALDRVLTILPETMQKKAHDYLVKQGARIMLKAPIVSARPGELALKDGTVIKAQTTIWTCGIQGAEFAGNLAMTKGRCSNRKCRFATTQGTCGLKECTFAKEHGWRYVDGKRGRLLVKETMQSADYPEVYVVGDLVWYFEGKAVVPQIVETAIQTAQTAAHNIIADIEGTAKKAHRSNYHGFMVSIGGRWGVAHVLGISLTGVFAMASKHMINVLHLFQLAGVSAVWDYLKFHFLDVKYGRSIVGGHMAATVRIYWVAVLRVFLGVMWCIEGIKKIVDGWLDPSKIFIVSQSAIAAAKGGAPAADAVATATASAAQVAQTATDAVAAASQVAAQAASTVADAVAAASASGGRAASAVADAVAAASQTVGQAMSQAADAVAAASQATGGAASQVADAVAAASQAGAWTSTADAVTSATQGAGQVVTALKPLIAQPLGIYTWLMNTFVVHAPFLFQAVIVLAEVAIGLALMGGMFTFVAAAASIGLCIMFTIGAMSTREILWFAVAAIVVMGGAGRGLGLDYWAMRWSQRLWNRTRLARKTYLLFDTPLFWPAERRRGRAAGKN
jgi:NADH:ubiquinone reductase (H+-translocating)